MASAVTKPPPSGDTVPLQAGSTSKGKKSKGYQARGPTAMPRNRGTGFEEYYADPPMTPAEFDEESILYDVSLNFAERIETCIQRYRARRRMDNERTLLFDKYLTLGGIDCQPRQFNTTAGIEKMDGLTNEDIVAMRATDVVRRGANKYGKYYSPENGDMWTVDFTGVVSGFLSVTLRAVGCSSDGRLTLGVDVVDNFLRYVQLHGVCPEYKDDVSKAREVCTRAKTELRACQAAKDHLPGQFNLACVKLFWEKPTDTATADLYGGFNPLEATSMTCDAAALVFQTTAKVHSDVLGEKAAHMAARVEDIHIVQTREADLEISAIVELTAEKEHKYASVVCGEDKGKDPICPSGVVMAKHCFVQEGYANQPQPSDAELAARGEEVLLLDKDVLAYLSVGMKMRVVMHDLDCGFAFVSMVTDLLPSFYTFLPQELMMEWKEPRQNEREAPSVENPEADDEAEQAEANADKEKE